ncbi:MAG: helix-turn-helix domain-containing protein [Bacteroidales bacterium]|nr:helix-turn-helix domain-containing protein [Bacteroidales bacterium]
MEPEEKPLFTLTIEQFKKLTRSIVAEEVKKIVSQSQGGKSEFNNDTDTCFIDQACQITGLKKPTIYSKLSTKQIPFLSRGKPLIFSMKHLQMWLEAGRPKTGDMNQIVLILSQRKDQGGH